MGYTQCNYEDVDQPAPGMQFLRNALECENLGFTVVDVDGEWRGKEHDHSDEGQEEVYLLIEGDGELTVDGETVPLEPGEAVRVDPDDSRQLSFDGSSKMVIAGAP